MRQIGEDVIIHETAIIKRPELVSIGDHVAIDAFFYMTTAAKICSYIHISSHVSVIGGKEATLIMEDFTTISAGCRLICASDDFAGGSGIINPFIPEQLQSIKRIQPIVIKKHAALGTNVIVFPGVTIGEGAVVGAGSIVTKSLDPWTVSLGTPARTIKQRPKETILQFEEEIRRRA